MAPDNPEERKPGEGSELLTFGEAAEFAQVSLMELRNQLRKLSIPTRLGWRGGVALQLVSLETLEQIYPGLAQRHRKSGPSLVERGIRLVHKEPEVSQASKEPKHPAPRAPKAQATNPKVPKPKTQPPSTQAPSTQPVARQPEPPVAPDEPDLKQLYREIEEATARNERLLEELAQAGEGLERLLNPAPVEAPPASRTPAAQRPLQATAIPIPLEVRAAGSASEEALARTEEWKRLVQAESHLERSHRRVQWASWSFAALLVFLVAYKGSDWMLAGPPNTGRPLPASDPFRAENELGSTLFAQGPTSEDFAQVPSPGEAAPAEPSGAPLVSFAEAVAAPNLLVPEPRPDSKPASGFMEASAPRKVESGVTEAAADSMGSASEFLDLVLSEDPACKFGNLTAPGQPLRDVLGPCLGPWNAELKAVAGGFRYAGIPLCRHHYTFQKELGGSIERASTVAHFAEQEGLVPPLVRLRVEHGASQLLQARVGKWVESGFEAGVSNSHRVTRQGTPDVWRIESWVRLQTGTTEAPELRHFTMEIELGADRGRDRLLSFAWKTVE
ncbi:MAG: hypothetical protein H6830_04705 [Planctomycetes bacterium]|nr:hypothetical protein [Planctomycetota bacterium]MCB9911268.1 hypothetical protein [Planctomycetota bacterium]HPF15516.1 hypothetical protein [Planctomycetota bacterium]